jgi:5-methylcytosine-specific restriction endonuclease McrA
MMPPRTTTARGYGRKWQVVRLLVLNRDQWRCWRCGGPAREVHHLRAISRYGPSYDPRYLVAACHPCNLAVREPNPSDRRPRFLDASGRPPRSKVYPGAIDMNDAR